MNIRRTERPHRYTNIDNEVINDPRLGAPTLGVLIYLLSKPNNWTAIKSELVARFKGPKHKLTTNALENCFKEMRLAGYAELKPIVKMGKNGKKYFKGSEYLIFDKSKIALQDVTDLEDVREPEDVPRSEISEAPKYSEPLISTDLNITTTNSSITTTGDKSPSESKEDFKEKEIERLKAALLEEKKKKAAPKKKRFVPPTLEEVGEFFEKNSSTRHKAKGFHLYYRSNGWKVGRVKMEDWEASAEKWIDGNSSIEKTQTQFGHDNYAKYRK